jgi:uncharacterized membrane protein YiaA
MDAQEYFESLTAQNYPAEEAEKYTQEHYPDFSLAPTAPAPIVMPAPGLTGTPDPAAGISMQGAPTSQEVNPIPVSGLVGMPMNMGAQQVILVEQPSAIWRIFSGLSGIILSGVIIYMAFELKKAYDEANTFIDGFDISLTDELESAISTVSTMWLLVILISIGLLIVSIIQFVNKPWASKALLGNTGLLFVTLVITGFFELALIEEIEEDMSLFETNGMFLSYCSGLCFLVFGLFAYLGRQKGPSVELQQM